jgi:predicted nucleic-acid-binding Zn-ribbon protein
MANSTQQCPKCNGGMEQGFVLDNTQGTQGVSQWAAGAPQKSFWTGMKSTGTKIPIGTFRCASCGYLEMYAREEFAAKHV